MHHVKKVPTTEEQKKQEEAKKTARKNEYIAATDFIFSMKEQENYTPELAEKTAKVLIKNPDVGTLWAIRRTMVEQSLQNYMGCDDKETEKKDLMNIELVLTQEALEKGNSKSYGAWGHRQWIITKMLENNIPTDFNREFALCSKALQLDCRNFHVWDHRRFIAKMAGCATEKELDFSTEQLNHNPSNYSAWHYRSIALSKIEREKCGSVKLDKTKLENEIQKATVAMMMDPLDQSSFAYAQWLLCLDSPKNIFSSTSEEEAVPISITFNGNQSTIVMSKGATVPTLRKYIRIADDEISLLIPHSTFFPKARSAIVWTFHSPQPLGGRLSNSEDYKLINAQNPLIRKDLLKLIFDCDSNRTPRNGIEALRNCMIEILALDEDETGEDKRMPSPWAKHMLVLCDLEEAPASRHKNIVDALNYLKNLGDPMRKELYMALLSQVKINEVLRQEVDGKQVLERIIDGEQDSLHLKPEEITSLKNIHYLAGLLKSLSVSQNLISNFDDLILPNLDHLTLQENNIKFIPPLFNLSNLVCLNLAGNGLNTPEDALVGLNSLPKLERFIFCEQPLHEHVKELNGLLKRPITLIPYWL